MQIIVLGMHRSGTSAVTRVINMMGAYLGPERELAGPAFDNKKGFWERLDVSELNNRTLAAMGATWDAVGSLDLKKLSAKAKVDFEQEAKRILSSLDDRRPWILKEPRLCLLFPLWRPLLEEPICIHVYRSPMEVAQSLKTRNGFSLSLGIALWEAYNRRALSASRDLPRILVDYGKLIEHPKKTARKIFESLTAAGVRGLQAPAEEETDAFIDQDLYHEREPAARRHALLNATQLELARSFEKDTVFLLPDVDALSVGGQEILDAHGAHLAALQQLDSRDRLEEMAADVIAENRRLCEENQRAIAELRQLLQGERTAQQAALAELRQLLQGERTAQQAARIALEAQIRRLEKELDDIHRSRLWRVADVYWRLLRKFRPDGGEVKGGREATAVDRASVPHVVARGVRPASAALRQTPISSYDVVCFPIIDFEFRFQRPQQMMVQFARHGHRTFYLRTDFHQEGPIPLIESIRDGIYGLQLPGPANLNLYRHAMERPVVDAMIRALEDLYRESRMGPAICLVQLPFWTPLALELRRKWGWKVIYDCMDEHSGFSTNEAAMLDVEKRLVEDSDLVITTSRALYDKVSPSAQRTILNPNGADFDHFREPRSGRLLTDLPPPIIGYFGAISEWFDVEMIHRAAAARPNWQFVLIGETYGANVSSLKELANVQLLGEQPYDRLPGYLHSFDVATIPFKITPLTAATNPVKFYEYLSAGVPVVASELPELAELRDFFYPARSRAEFLSQLETALAEGADDAKRSQRIEFARQNSWTTRFARIDEAIRESFGRAAIIIVSYNNLEYLQLCLESLEQKTLYPNFEVVVVDNASGSEVTNYLQVAAERKPWLKVIFNQENLGFPRANNIGLQAVVHCEYVVLLNDDVVVTRGWLSRLLQCLETEGVELVGPTTNWAGNEARIEVDYENLKAMDAFAERYTQRHEGESFEIKVLALFCVALRRSLLDRIGLLDERFGIGMFEDDDLAERIRRSGGRLICTKSVFIHHWGRSSFGALDKATYDSLFEENRRRFEEKWGEPWIPHRYRD